MATENPSRIDLARYIAGVEKARQAFMDLWRKLEPHGVVRIPSLEEQLTALEARVAMPDPEADASAPDEQTGAEDGTEITAEMIEAGADAILEKVGGADLGGFFSPEDLAVRVYLAMKNSLTLSSAG